MENNKVLKLRHAGLLLTCETGARWSGVLGNQMWVKGCVIVKILKSMNKGPCVPSTFAFGVYPAKDDLRQSEAENTQDISQKNVL